jgi:hypothetical protein
MGVYTIVLNVVITSEQKVREYACDVHMITSEIAAESINR